MRSYCVAAGESGCQTSTKISLVVTQNLTKRHSELLEKVRSLDNVECAWTIICLLADGKKVAIQTERYVPAVRGQ